MARDASDGGRGTECGAAGGRVNVWTILGVLFIAAAIALTVYNLCDERRAGVESSRVLERLSATNDAPLLQDPVRVNISPDIPMPTEEVEGGLYIGTLRIPALDLELPVMSEWSEEGLRLAPCRYSGSAYADDLVIAAHNYATHFGGLRNLAYGSEVSFVDIRGNVFVYEVASIETLGAFDVKAMTESEWELTLFTCTLDGGDRVTVRCLKVSV